MKLKFNTKRPYQKRKDTRISREKNIEIIKTSTTPLSIKKAKRSLRLSIAWQNIQQIAKSIVTLILALVPFMIASSYRSALFVQTYNSNDIDAKTLWAVQEQLSFINIIAGALLLCGLLFTYHRIQKLSFIKYRELVEK